MTHHTKTSDLAQLGRVIHVIEAAEKTGMPLSPGTTHTARGDIARIAQNTHRDIERLKEFMTRLDDVMTRLKAVSK